MLDNVYVCSMCKKHFKKTYKKSHLVSKLGEQKIGSGATAYKLGERSRRSRHGSRAPATIPAIVSAFGYQVQLSKKLLFFCGTVLIQIQHINIMFNDNFVAVQLTELQLLLVCHFNWAIFTQLLTYYRLGLVTKGDSLGIAMAGFYKVK